MSEEKKIDRRTWLKIVGGTVGGLIVGGVAGYYLRKPEVIKEVSTVTTTVKEVTTPTIPVTPAKVTLTVIHAWPGEEWPLFEPLVEDSKKKLNIDIKPICIRTPDLVPIISSMFPVGTTPGDVIFTWWKWLYTNQAKGGHLIDVSDLFEGEKPYLLPGMYERYVEDGKAYAVPHAGQKVRSCLWYRKSFFKEHGLTLPKSWDDFISLLKEISEISGIKAPIVNGNGSWPISLNNTLDVILLTYGGYELHEGLARGKVKWTDEQVKKVLSEHYIPLLKYFSEPTEWVSAIELWWRGDYAIYPNGSWITAMVKDPSDVGLLLLPEQKSIAYTYDCWFVPKYTSYPNEAKALLKYFLSKEGGTLQVKQGGFLPARTDIPVDVLPPVDREIWEMVKNLKVAISPIEGSIGGIFTEKLFSNHILLWSNPTKLDSVLEDLQKAVEEELKK